MPDPNTPVPPPDAEPAPMTPERLEALRAIVDAQPEGATPAWRKSRELAAEIRPQHARERRDEARSTLSHDRRERRSRRRNLQLAKPGPQKVAAQAALDEIEEQITRDRAELRKAEHVLSRYTPREPRHETARPQAPSRSKAPFVRRVLPRRAPIARAAARRPGCRRTTRSTGPPGDDGGSEPPGEIAGRHLTAGAPT